MQTCAAAAASRPSGIATTAVRGVIRSLTGRWANASTPETTAISPAEARAPVSAPESTAARVVRREGSRAVPRSEEHTSELQSRQYLVCRLVLEKNKRPPGRCEHDDK